MNLFQLECFLAVASHLNFARAAEQLHVTQPTVSHQIRSLEKELGVSLFTRVPPRSVALTGEGRIFLLDAKGIVAQSHTAIQRFAQRDQGRHRPPGPGLRLHAGPGPAASGPGGGCASGSPACTPTWSPCRTSSSSPGWGEGALDGVIALGQTSRAGPAVPGDRQGGVPLPAAQRPPPGGKGGPSPRRTWPGSPCSSRSQTFWAARWGPTSSGWPRAASPRSSTSAPSHETAAHLTAAGFGVSFLPDTYRLPLGQDLVSLPLLGFPPLPYGLFYKAPRGKRRPPGPAPGSAEWVRGLSPA